MKIIQKFKLYCRGEIIPPTTEELFDQDTPPINRYKQPLWVKIFSIIGKFFFAHWMWLIGTLITLAILGVAILQYIREQ